MTNQEMVNKLLSVMSNEEIQQKLLKEHVGKGSTLRNRIKRLYNEAFGMVNNFEDVYLKYNGFIHKISIEFSKRYRLDKDDVYQECLVGLLEASKTKTIKEITYFYLYKVMRNNVLKELLKLKKQEDVEVVDIFDPQFINQFYEEEEIDTTSTEQMALLKKYLTDSEIKLMCILINNGRDGTQEFNNKIQKVKQKMKAKGDLQ